MSASYDHLLKLCVAGDSSVGKTSLIRRYMRGCFTDPYFTCLGIDFDIKTIKHDLKTLKLQIWDTAGKGERFRTMTPAYYRSAHGILLCYDVTYRSSFENVSSWMTHIREHAPEDVSLMLVGTKFDSYTKREVSVEEGQALAESYSIPFSETSAKDDINVQAVVDQLASAILTRIARIDHPVAFTLLSVTSTNSSLLLSVAKLSGQTLDIKVNGTRPLVEGASLAIAEACGLSSEAVKLLTLDGTLLDAADYLPTLDDPATSWKCTIQ